MDILFTGTIVAESPISVSKPDAPEQDKGVVFRNTVTDNKVEERLVIAGETLRGKLRRVSASVVRDALIRNGGGGFNLSEHYLYTVGGVKGSDKQSTEDLLKIGKIRQANPFFALWGAGEIWIRGRAQIGDAVADGNRAARDDRSTVRSDDFTKDPALLAGLDPDDQKSYASYSDARKEISVMKAEKKEIDRALKKMWADEKKTGKKIDQNEVERLRGRIGDLDKEIKNAEEKAKEQGGAEKSVNQLLSLSALAAGSRMTHKMRLVNVSEIEAGLFLETLKALANDCRIGGKASLGFGDFSADWSLLMRNAPYGEFVDAGHIRVSPYEPEPLAGVTGDLLTNAIGAWRAFSESVGDASIFLRDPRKAA